MDQPQSFFQCISGAVHQGEGINRRLLVTAVIIWRALNITCECFENGPSAVGWNFSDFTIAGRLETLSSIKIHVKILPIRDHWVISTRIQQDQFEYLIFTNDFPILIASGSLFGEWVPFKFKISALPSNSWCSPLLLSGNAIYLQQIQNKQWHLELNRPCPFRVVTHRASSDGRSPGRN